MHRSQNNGSVKAVYVSPRHCPATCAQLFQLLCWTESQRQCPLHCCWRTTWTTRSERSPTFAVQLHLPTHDLFWATLKVQLHLPPLRSLDLLISPGTMCATQCWLCCLSSQTVRKIYAGRPADSVSLCTVDFGWQMCEDKLCRRLTNYSRSETERGPERSCRINIRGSLL